MPASRFVLFPALALIVTAVPQHSAAQTTSPGQIRVLPPGGDVGGTPPPPRRAAPVERAAQRGAQSSNTALDRARGPFRSRLTTGNPNRGFSYRFGSN